MSSRSRGHDTIRFVSDVDGVRVATGAKLGVITITRAVGVEHG